MTAKPAADGETGARRIADAAKSTGNPALTTCPARFDDGIGTLATRIDAGEIGEVVAVRASIRHDRVPIEGIEANAEHAPDQAGAIYAMGYYTADALCWLADARPRRTFAEFDNVNTPYSAHSDIGTATVRFANGTQGTMTVTYSTDCRERLGNWEIEVVGTDGIGRTTHTGYEGLVWHGGTPEERSVEAFARTQSPILDRQFATFVDAARLAEYPDIVPRPEAVTEALALCDRWEESVQSGEAIDW
jgi:predicted dehydrogenase